MAQVLATADIGSNTVHLLVAETDGKKVRRLENRSEWIALGETVARLGHIPAGHADQLVQILRDFRQISAAFRAAEFYVFATEAVRAAENHDQVLERIRKEVKLAVDVIPPKTEAEYSLRGSKLDADLGGELTFFEVGGGSAQIASVRNDTIEAEYSLRMGTGRVLAESGIKNPCPPAELETARHYIQSTLATIPELPRKPATVASGGVVRGLWRAVHPDGERRLALEEVRYLAWSAARLTVERAAARFNCKMKRAATLLPGALIYEALMLAAGTDEITISEYGVREGAVLSMAQGKVPAWLG